MLGIGERQEEGVQILFNLPSTLGLFCQAPLPHHVPQLPLSVSLGACMRLDAIGLGQRA